MNDAPSESGLPGPPARIVGPRARGVAVAGFIGLMLLLFGLFAWLGREA